MKCTKCKARYCYRRSSVRPSVRPFETLMYRGRICWVSSKVITRIISLPQRRQSSPKGTSLKFGWNRGGVGLLRKRAISLKWGKIGPRLLLMTNRKSIRAFDWCQNQRPWMTVKGHYALCFKTRASFGAHHENLNEDKPTLSATKM